MFPKRKAAVIETDVANSASAFLGEPGMATHVAMKLYPIGIHKN
jgi:hypothetical protein